MILTHRGTGTKKGVATLMHFTLGADLGNGTPATI